jgi:putative chitinase
MTPFEHAIEVLGGEAYVLGIVANADKWGINTPLRQAHWLAQMAHESEGFRYVRELWGPTAQQRKYEPPGALADELGNQLPGDGIRFRGRGFIQVTGRTNYAACSVALYGDSRLLFNPELLEHDPAASAGWYWATRNINRLADRDDVRKVTKAINGGYTGLDDRNRRLAIAKQAMEAAFRAETNATN